MKYGQKNGTFRYSANYFCLFTGSRAKDINVLDLDDKGSWFRLHWWPASNYLFAVNRETPEQFVKSDERKSDEN